MSRTIRFPLLAPVISVGPAETSLVIQLFAGNTLFQGGGNGTTSIAAWKTIQRDTETPFPCVAIEFISNSDDAFVIGDGTFAEQIGLYGSLVDPAGVSRNFLIGVLGIARGGVAPQIPLTVDPTGDRVGYAQLVSDVSVYDGLSVGGVVGNIVMAHAITIRARPIRSREYLG